MVPVQRALDIDAPGQKVVKHYPDPRSFASLRMTVCRPGQKVFRLLTDPGSFASLRMTVCRPGQKVFRLLPDTKGRHSSQEVPRMRVTQLGSLASCVLIALLVSSLVLLLGPGSRASAMANNGVAGHVYVLNNDLSGSNSITVFKRQEDGSLKLLGTTSIGGLGSVAAFADGTQGSLILARDERTRLFAVDAGSDQISVVNVHGEHLSLAGVFASGGAGPVSLSYQDGLLYVLNAANGRTQAANVAGFHVDDQGRLHPIAGATQPLSAAHPNAAQVQIDPYVTIPCPTTCSEYRAVY